MVPSVLPPVRLSDGVEPDVAECGMRRGFCPRDFTWNTEQRRYSVVAKRQDGLRVFPAWARDVDVSVDERIGGNASHPGTSGTSNEDPQDYGRLRKGLLLLAV